MSTANGDSEPDDLVFLSPDSSPGEGQGASPQLRRSNRKRKSTSAGVGACSSMPRSSGKKKKTASPKNNAAGQDMPKIPRTPTSASARVGPGTGPTQQQQEPTAGTTEQSVPDKGRVGSMESFLLAMEGRLTGRMDKINEKVEKAISLANRTNKALGELEEKVEQSEEAMAAKLDQAEQRILDKVEARVGDLVLKKLTEAGFDPDLSAGNLSRVAGSSYANVTSRSIESSASTIAPLIVEKSPAIRTASNKTQEERREEKYWECRRSLRLWPVPGATQASLHEYMTEKLKLDEVFVKEMGGVVLREHRDPRSKIKDEVYATFETKEVRDAVRGRAHYLADYQDAAGMRLHVPNHLQRDFRALMSIAYELKKKNNRLKRNVKFDDNKMNLFIDIQVNADEPWSRIRPEEARKALTNRRGVNGPAELGGDDLKSLLGEEVVDLED